jgi:hypothetical protein
MNIEELGHRLELLPSVWLALEERMCLLKYAGMSQGNLVEIGAGWGGSACILVLGSNHNVISVDPMEPPLCQVDGWDITADKVRVKVHEVLGSLADHWTLWTVTSQFAAEYYAKWTPDINLGLVFIDGNHDYSYVRQDVDLWLPLIQPHGFLILHDSCRDPNQPDGSNLCGYPGPTRVAQELSHDPRVKLIETAYSMTVWEVQ